MTPQHTLRTAVSLSGIGLHGGRTVQLRVEPAPAGSGIVFRRTDLGIPASTRVHPGKIVDTRLSTVLEFSEQARVSTIEHLMSALAGCDIDNAVVSLDGPEVPVMDGSSTAFVAAFKRAGVRAQRAPRRFLRIRQAVMVRDGDKWARLAPAPGRRFDLQIDFDHPAVRNMPARAHFDLDGDDYARLLAPCRTFGFLSDLEKMRAAGLALGGSLDNAVVLDASGVVNAEGLRRPDELVRHKLLDAIGDLYVLGLPILGAFSGYKSGHALNNRLLRQLLATPQAWEISEREPALARVAA